MIDTFNQYDKFSSKENNSDENLGSNFYHKQTNENKELVRFLNSEINELTDLLVELNTPELKDFLIRHKNILHSLNINIESITTYDDLDVYTLIAKEVCSFENIKQYPDLDYCFNLAKEAVDQLGGDQYILLEEH